MTIGSLATMLNQLDHEKELIIEIIKEGGETATTYDIGFDYSEYGDFVLRVHE